MGGNPDKDKSVENPLKEEKAVNSKIGVSPSPSGNYKRQIPPSGRVRPLPARLAPFDPPSAAPGGGVACVKWAWFLVVIANGGVVWGVVRVKWAWLVVVRANEA